MKLFFKNYIINCTIKLKNYLTIIENKNLPNGVPEREIKDFISSLLHDLVQFEKQEGLLDDDLFPRNLRAFRTLLLKIEKLEYYGMPIITHYNKEYDSYFNKMMQSVNEEIQSPVNVPYICSLSNARDYFWYESTFSTIYVPAIEKYSILNLPDLYHELAHHIVKEYKSYFKEKEDEWFENYSNLLERQKITSDINNPRVLNDSLQIFSNFWPNFWSEEIICDLFATFCLGQAYAWTHLKLCHLKKAELEQDTKFEIYQYSETHPPDAFRMSAIFKMMEYLKINFNDIKTAWKDYAFILDNQKTPLYDFFFPDSLLNDYVNHVVTIFDENCIVPCTKNIENTSSIVYRLNHGWELFISSQEKLSKFENEFYSLFDTTDKNEYS